MSSQALWWRSFFSSTKQLLQHPPPPGAPAPRPGQGPEQRDPVGNRGPWGAQRSPGRGGGRSWRGEAQGNNHPRVSPAPSSRPPPPDGSRISHARPRSAPRCSPGTRRSLPVGAVGRRGGTQRRAAQHTRSSALSPGGERAKGATVVVPTGAEQTVPIRIKPHPSRWTGLLRTPPPGAMRRSSARRRGISAVPAACRDAEGQKP